MHVPDLNGNVTVNIVNGIVLTIRTDIDVILYAMLRPEHMWLWGLLFQLILIAFLLIIYISNS
jgi:hypothetical protein